MHASWLDGARPRAKVLFEAAHAFRITMTTIRRTERVVQTDALPLCLAAHVEL